MLASTSSANCAVRMTECVQQRCCRIFNFARLHQKHTSFFQLNNSFMNRMSAYGERSIDFSGSRASEIHQNCLKSCKQAIERCALCCDFVKWISLRVLILFAIGTNTDFLWFLFHHIVAFNLETFHCTCYFSNSLFVRWIFLFSARPFRGWVTCKFFPAECFNRNKSTNRMRTIDTRGDW